MKKILLLTFVISSLWSYSQDHVHAHFKSSDYGVYDQDLLPKEFHQERRNKLRELMPENAVSILFAAPIRNRSNDVDYEYHQNPNFYYLTGLREPHAVVLIFKNEVEIDGNKTNEIIFVQNRDKSAEVWTGKRLGVEGTQELLGINTIYTNDQFKKLDLGLEKMEQIYYIHPGEDIKDVPMNSNDLYGLTRSFEEKIDTLKTQTKNKYKLKKWMAELREIKTEEEMHLLRKAIDLTCTAQIELMKALEPGMKEFQSEAIVEFHFKHGGAEYTGFPTIHGSGENSCILHYTENRKPMIDGDLLVSDIGAEYHGYTADVTRTIPVDGKYSEEEAIIYNIVLKAQEAGIKECKEGNSFWDPHSAATKVITEELLKLGIIKDKKEVKKYFMHGTSHYLGLDVHDMGTYGPLQAGNVITVEPGIYIAAGSDCDPKWWNIGVRIEDDILITKGEPENLSACVPRKIKEIEALMKEKSIINGK